MVASEGDGNEAITATAVAILDPAAGTMLVPAMVAADGERRVAVHRFLHRKHLDAYIKTAGIGGDKTSPLFRTLGAVAASS